MSLQLARRSIGLIGLFVGSTCLYASDQPQVTHPLLTSSFIIYRMTEDFIIKYFWSAAGYGLMSIPLLFGKKAVASRGISTSSTVASRTESKHSARPKLGRLSLEAIPPDYVSNRRLLLSLADAGGRLMYSGKEISELVGYTSRVYGLLSALHMLDTNSYPAVGRPAHLAKDQVGGDWRIPSAEG